MFFFFQVFEVPNPIIVKNSILQGVKKEQYLAEKRLNLQFIESFYRNNFKNLFKRYPIDIRKHNWLRLNYQNFNCQCAKRINDIRHIWGTY